MKSYLKPYLSISMIIALLSLFAITGTASMYDNYFPGLHHNYFQDITSHSAWASPPTVNPVTLGVQDDGLTVYVNKGDELRFTFNERGGADTWHMRANQDVVVISDLVLESYPMQHVITVKVLAPTDIYLDRDATPDGGKKTVGYLIGFYGNSVIWPGGGDYVPDPTFDIPPVIIRGNNGGKWVTVPDPTFDNPLAVISRPGY